MAGARAMPYDVALARVVEQIPAPGALEGGCRYEPKWDGYLHWTLGLFRMCVLIGRALCACRPERCCRGRCGGAPGEHSRDRASAAHVAGVAGGIACNEASSCSFSALGVPGAAW